MCITFHPLLMPYQEILVSPWLLESDYWLLKLASRSIMLGRRPPPPLPKPKHQKLPILLNPKNLNEAVSLINNLNKLYLVDFFSLLFQFSILTYNILEILHLSLSIRRQKKFKIFSSLSFLSICEMSFEKFCLFYLSYKYSLWCCVNSKFTKKATIWNSLP